MKLGDVLDDGKTKPRSAKRTAPVLVDAIEPLEYPRLAIGRNTDAKIGDANLAVNMTTGVVATEGARQ